MPTQEENPPIPHLADLRTEPVRATTHCGFVNSAALTSMGRNMYQCYAISVAQSLFSCREFAKYLENHATRRSAFRGAATDFRSPHSCYVCSLFHAYICLSGDHVCPLAPNEHGLIPGAGWSNVIPILHGESIRNMSPSAVQHSASEYIETIIPYIGRTEAHMASFLAHKTDSCHLEDGSYGCPYSQCMSCGGAPLAVRPPITSLTVRLPMVCEVPYSVSELHTHDNVIQGPLGEYTTDCRPLAHNSALCDAPLVRRNNGGQRARMILASSYRLTATATKRTAT